jgi:hypothetical protein
MVWTLPHVTGSKLLHTSRWVQLIGSKKMMQQGRKKKVFDTHIRQRGRTRAVEVHYALTTRPRVHPQLVCVLYLCSLDFIYLYMILSVWIWSYDLICDLLDFKKLPFLTLHCEWSRCIGFCYVIPMSIFLIYREPDFCRDDYAGDYTLIT